MNTTGSRLTLSLLVVAAAVSMTSCVDERVIYRDRPIFQEPAEAALDFLGYANPADTDSKLTVCGQCHVGQQSKWEQTGHAFAWQGLQGSDHAQAFCEACHTVNSYGNIAGPEGEAVGGWVAVNDARYHDVQCESCHGPGLPHVRNPSLKDVQPHAPITVGAELAFGCGECHSGAHHPFVDEWAASPHGNVSAYPAARMDNQGGCYSCHSGEGALRRMGVQSNYLEKDVLLASGENFANITCAVCHDPHSNENQSQLRFPSNTANMEEHICAQCHNRSVVPGSGPRGLSVHAPEAPLVAGELQTVGWIPPGMDFDEDQIRGSHGSAANPRLCSTCHVVAFETADPLTGGTFYSVGHSFRAIPCVDENGIPTGAENCAMTTTARDWRGCTNGCHGDALAVVSALNTATGNALNRARELYGMLRQIDPNLAGAGGPIDPTDPTFTVAEGAYFNLQLAHHGTAVHQTDWNVTRADSMAAFAPSVTHNPFLINSLLFWSIEAVQAEYGVSPSPSYDPTPPVFTSHP